MSEHAHAHVPELTPAEAEQLAQDAANAMWSRDHVAQSMAMALDEVRPGFARLSMVIRQDMVNGHAICHGGMLFTLADTAFAYACNSHNHNTVASACHIDFLAPSHLGETLVAEAHERALSGRAGVYDVTVSTAKGKTVALFRGKSARIKGEVTASLVQA
ncbi:MAG: hydroxyphenylacetyl-CoA thioesterase PaaI [Rhodoferax sp.]|nr:hydroxyphenylacetyl-CoA thioesterase PaaI [Rhodoferax sp.]